MRKAVRILSIIVATFFVVQPFSYAKAQTIYTEFEPVESNQINAADTTSEFDVVKELYDQINRFEKMAEDAGSVEEIQQLEELIVTTKLLINDYLAYSEESYPAANYAARSNASLSASVSTVVAYFNSQGYYLSAELLTHARNNTTINSNYTPSYGYLCNGSPLLAQIWKDSTTSGSGVFPKSGTATALLDLYYAIHAFNYTKTISLSNSSLNVSDRYDYASGDYTGVAGVAVNTMYQAQQAGILVPYYVKINVNPNSLIWL